MVTLHASSKRAHIIHSIRDYIHDNLVTTAGLSVWHHGVTEFSTPARWVGWFPHLLTGAIESEGWQDGIWWGTWVRGFLELTLAEKVQSRTNIYALPDMLDIVMPYFRPPRTVIPVYDYSEVSDPQVGVLYLNTPTDRGTDNGSESGIAQWSISVPVLRLELTSL